MQYEITTPDGVVRHVTTEDVDYINTLPAKGYTVREIRVKPKVHISDNACTSCEG